MRAVGAVIALDARTCLRGNSFFDPRRRPNLREAAKLQEHLSRDAGLGLVGFQRVIIVLLWDFMWA
jgi:hypothetical protein